MISWNDEQLIESVEWKSILFQPHALGQLRTTESLSSKLNWLVQELKEYFRAGKPFEDPWNDFLNFLDVSDFQKSVYQTISKIPHGETRSYAWVARKMGKMLAARAVGQALRCNPFAVIVPCHRVVSAQEGIGGFMGVADPGSPELSLKKNLLSLERQYIEPVFPFLLHA